MRKKCKPESGGGHFLSKCSSSNYFKHKAARRPSKFITLLTDFGLADTYVGVMKGVIAGVNPEANVTDLCHDVASQDLHEAAFLLAASYRYFPAGTIHVVVVDPTVGTERRALCVRSGDYFFVGPDNGVLSMACRQAGSPAIFVLENENFFLEEPSRTFHGRDIFAPVAGHLSAGIPPESLGRRVRSMKRLDFPSPVIEPGKRIVGEIIHVDKFGNLISNIDEPSIRKGFPRSDRCRLEFSCGRHTIKGLSEVYGDVAPGVAVALFGSYNLMEMAVRNGNASLALGIERGEQVIIERGKRGRGR